jgi:hypothetical protein
MVTQFTSSGNLEEDPANRFPRGRAYRPFGQLLPRKLLSRPTGLRQPHPRTDASRARCPYPDRRPAHLRSLTRSRKKWSSHASHIRKNATFVRQPRTDDDAHRLTHKHRSSLRAGARQGRRFLESSRRARGIALYPTRPEPTRPEPSFKSTRKGARKVVTFGLTGGGPISANFEPFAHGKVKGTLDLTDMSKEFCECREKG